jgi:ADP-heptose:LPS heptosyltransferase
MNTKKKTLILRFSSVGDVVQTLSAAQNLAEAGHEVHWAIRVDLAPLIQYHPAVFRVWKLERRDGLRGLITLFWQLRRENFDFVYDAHDSTRSNFIFWGLRLIPTLKQIVKERHFLKRNLQRARRFIWIKFKKNWLTGPQEAQLQILEPLAEWGVETTLPKTPQFFIDPKSREIAQTELKKYQLTNYIALCPSAAHDLKRWPIEHWRQLIQLLPNQKFAILGGPQDTFLSELVELGPDRVINFAGRLTLLESAAVIDSARVTITNDTGMMHIAEQLLKPTFALLGPAPFGYPSRHQTTTRVFERDLECRPCSKHGQGPCINPNFKECLKSITPIEIVEALKNANFI